MIHRIQFKLILLRPVEWGYRHKAQLQAGILRGRTALGLYSTASRRLVDIAGCPVQHPDINRAADAIRGIVEELGIPPLNEIRSSSPCSAA
ncbi:MAG: hypothetical protein BAA02_02885 [Paenibacillaceae bacterium ZCTH02-B3]|nr:MAG: hypothetical protein BAA02_02885 [Paenibacillaceae bacterium ZCTH02-B3]